MGIKIFKPALDNYEGFVTRKLNGLLSIVSPRFPRGKVIRPSDLADCTLKLVCDILGFPCTDKITPQQQRIFDNGNSVHKRYLSQYLKKLNMSCVLYDVKDNIVTSHDFIEQGIKSKIHWIKGSPDAIIFNDEDGLQYVFELKSIKQELFNELEAPDFKYLVQVTIYMFLTKIPRAIIFYENKNDQRTKEFSLTLDNNLLNSLLEKISIIQKFVEEYPTTGKLPECDCRGTKICLKYHIPNFKI